MTNLKLIILTSLATLLLSMTTWARMSQPDDDAQALTAAEIAILPATPDGDLRLMDDLRRQCDNNGKSWHGLPSSAQPVYLTLWAEEIHRTMTWGQRAAIVKSDDSSPTFDEIADAYQIIGCPEIAQSIRGLAAPYSETVSAFQEWSRRRETESNITVPSTQRLDTAANKAFAQLTEIRLRRLEYVRNKSHDLDIK